MKADCWRLFVFNDPTLKWRPYPSVIDGIERPPYVFDRGFWRGVLHLTVTAPEPSSRAYGIELPCDIYYGIEEMLHSVAMPAFKSGSYDGSIYIKEAESSALLNAYSTLLRDYRPTDFSRHTPRHFLFVGADLCYEALGIAEPSIRTFRSREEAYAWSPGHR
jgi:hypothetical protein